MFQHVLTLLPRKPGTISLLLSGLGSVLGLGFWLAGARFSRSILTLAAVGLGTSVGLRLPGWCGWSVDGMGTAVGAAVVLGVSAFALPRVWIGLWLGIVLALWTALIFWTSRDAAAHWHWPAYAAASTLPKYLAALSESLPGSVRLYLGCSAIVAMVAGVCSAFLWPRVSGVVLWSAAGVSLVFATGIVALRRLSPAALAHLPRQTAAQLLLVAGLVAAGAILQWQTVPSAETADSTADSENSTPDSTRSSGASKKSSGKHKIAD